VRSRTSTNQLAIGAERTELVDIVQRGVQDLFVELFRVDNGDDDRVELAQRAELPVSPSVIQVGQQSFQWAETLGYRLCSDMVIRTLLGVRLVRVTLTAGLTAFRLPPLMLTEVCSPCGASSSGEETVPRVAWVDESAATILDFGRSVDNV